MQRYKFKRVEVIAIVLTILVVISFTLTWIQIKRFMPVFDTCKDDLEIIKTCNCVPCQWKDAEKTNGNGSCEVFRQK